MHHGVADFHLDLLIDLELRRTAGERDVFRRRHQQSFRAADVRVQVLPTYVDEPLMPESALRTVLRQIDAARCEEEDSQGALRIVTTQAELDEALADGALAGVLAMEGVDALGRDPDLLRTVHRLGVRSIGLTWNGSNAFADGLAEDRGVGITPTGERLLDEMAALGIALDLSHLTPRGCERALERFDGPVFASHANARAVCRHRRNLDDDLLAAIGERGGVVGLACIPSFLGPGDPIDRARAHHDHVRAVAGRDATAFGADFCDWLPGPDLGPPLVPDDPTPEELALAEQPEPSRERFHADVLDAVPAEQRAPLARDNALRFLRTVLP
jgi:membrane dipeptidase